MSIADVAAANVDPWNCDFQNGTPIPCTSGGLQPLGPWGYNELPANLPFTFTFVNTSDVADAHQLA